MIMKKNILVLSAAFFTSAWLAACNSGNQPFPEPPAATEIKETETTAEVKKTAEFSTGSWDGYTFTSPWLNLTFTFPEDCTILRKSWEPARRFWSTMVFPMKCSIRLQSLQPPMILW